MSNNIQQQKNKVWNAGRVAECISLIEQGREVPGGTPFYEGDIGYRAENIVYEYSDYEMQEIAKCAADVVYFADNYCVAMTDYGIQKIKLRDYQKEMLKAFQDHRFNVCLASRQIGKTVSTSIFICWYLLFNVDKNVMVLANKGATSAEILDKIKAVIKGLPFFLKPGLIQNNVMTMRFDNGCRIMAQSTSKTAAIGFTLHLVYMDEFAHIQSSFIESFYRSVYPTISSSKISRVIITSTPNKKNKFWEIYQGAIDKANGYNPLRIDWWQVPGRDDEWKKNEIANLGSEELFNQEYGNQFLAGDDLLLGGSSLTMMKRIHTEYLWEEIIQFEDEEIDYKEMKWHPKFKLNNIDSLDKFVFTIDIADGAGKDYSVINLFKIIPLSISSIKRLKRDRVEDERGMFRLKQIGLFRSNKAGAEELAKICKILVFKILSPDNVRIAVEMNFKGDMFVEKFSNHEDFYEDIFLYTKHNIKNNRTSIGIKLGEHNKMYFCREFRKLIMEKRIVLDEKITYDEMSDFGINSRGKYSSQSGHDDVAMSCIHLVPYIMSDSFADQVEEMHDILSEKTKTAILDKLAELDIKEEDSSMSYIKELIS